MKIENILLNSNFLYLVFKLKYKISIFILKINHSYFNFLLLNSNQINLKTIKLLIFNGLQ